MANETDNMTVRDGANVPRQHSIRTTVDEDGNHVPHHIVSVGGEPVGADNPLPVSLGGVGEGLATDSRLAAVLDAVTALAANGLTSITRDDTGTPFDPNACSYSYDYNPDGTVAAETATEQGTGIARKQTYTYTDGSLSATSLWVRQ